jgi:UDP-2,3-diacylglucosamine pyrophosphatase LpxH
MSDIEARKFRTLFLSDIHLGSKGAKAEYLIDFLRHNEADTIYLVGDIVDGWRLRRSWHWPQSHNDVVQKLLRQARKGVTIKYIAGTMTSSCGNSRERISAVSSCRTARSTRQLTASAFWSFMATSSIR